MSYQSKDIESFFGCPNDFGILRFDQEGLKCLTFERIWGPPNPAISRKVVELESQLATAQADLESTKVECTILRASGQDEALVRAFVQGALYGETTEECNLNIIERNARRLVAEGKLGKEAKSEHECEKINRLDNERESANQTVDQMTESNRAYSARRAEQAKIGASIRDAHVKGTQRDNGVPEGGPS